MTQLGMLDLTATSVSDAGLANLKGMTRLQWLYLYSTQTSGSGDRELQQTLPRLDIVRGHSDSILPGLGVARPADRSKKTPMRAREVTGRRDGANLRPRPGVTNYYNPAHG